LDNLEEERILVEEERVRRAKVKADLENVAIMQEVSWRQKSRVTWLKEGDHNTRCFHYLANSHRRNYFISSLCIEGTITSKQGVIIDTITQFSFFFF
jgi:hypothetical protein